MDAPRILVTLAGAGLIALTLWFFFGGGGTAAAPPKPPRGRPGAGE